MQLMNVFSKNINNIWETKVGGKRGKIDRFSKLITKDNLESTNTSWVIDNAIKYELNYI